MAGSRRMREVERVRLERQAARRAAARARARRRNAAIGAVVSALLVLGAVVFVAVKLSSGSGSDPASPPRGALCLYTRPTAAPTPARDVGFPPINDIAKKGSYAATMDTNRGAVTFDLLTAQAPCTTNAIRYLAEKKYFDKTPCHRLTSGRLSVLQCGDPTGTGSGGPGFVYADENLKGATYPAGTIAMANSGPNSNGSQFFLVYADSELPPSYIPFGKITSGLDVLMKVAAGGSTPPGDGKPKLPVTINTFTVAKKS